MDLSHLYNTHFLVYRNQETYDEFNRPSTSLSQVAEGDGRLKKNKVYTKSKDPQEEKVIKFNLHTSNDIDIKTNDIIEINGNKYKAEPPISYKYHQEIGLVFEEGV